MLKVTELLEATRGRLIAGKKDIKVNGISIDSRTLKPQDAFIAIKGNNFDGHNFIEQAIKKGTTCIIREQRAVAQGISKVATLEVKNTIQALGDIARFQRNKFNIPVIAITGSNGKTTTKEMLAWVLSQRFKVLKNEGTKNNQFGLPLTLLKLNSHYDMAVLEVGTNHFGEVRYLAKICLPNIGMINNIGPAHLEYLRDLGGVFQEKYALIEELKAPYIAILNSDDSLLRRQVLKRTKRPFILSFGIKNKSDFFAREVRILNRRIEFLVNAKYKFRLKTAGYYNVYNALAAICVARIFGLEYSELAKRLSNFEFPPGRLRYITLKKIKFIDDTYNSNPLSLKQALDTLANFRAGGRKIFVMGDMLELGRDKEFWHSQVGQKIRGACDTFITVGKLSKFSAQQAAACGFALKNIFTCESTHQARDILFKQMSLTSDDVVLVKGSRAMKMEEVFRV